MADGPIDNKRNKGSTLWVGGFFVRVKSGRIPSFVGYSSDIARMGPNPNFRIGFIRRSYENFVPRSNRARMKVRTKLFVWNREVRMNRYFGTSPHTSSVRALSDICRMSDVWSSYKHRISLAYEKSLTMTTAHFQRLHPNKKKIRRPNKTNKFFLLYLFNFT